MLKLASLNHSTGRAPSTIKQGLSFLLSSLSNHLSADPNKNTLNNRLLGHATPQWKLQCRQWFQHLAPLIHNLRLYISSLLTPNSIRAVTHIQQPQKLRSSIWIAPLSSDQFFDHAWAFLGGMCDVQSFVACGSSHTARFFRKKKGREKLSRYVSRGTYLMPYTRNLRSNSVQPPLGSGHCRGGVQNWSGDWATRQPIPEKERELARWSIRGRMQHG